MSNLLFNYNKLVGGGDPSFAVDYMVERILETNAVYAEPTQEVIEKVDDLANYKSPEDADDYIWSWLDGLAEEKGTFVYTLMFDQVWVSDGSSYDLYDYDISEDDEEAIKFAGSPLEENKTLNEIMSINSVEFEALVDRLVDKGFKYYPHDPNYDRTTYSIFLWLEDIAGDNQRAFTFYPQRNNLDQIVNISLFIMPGEQAFYYDSPTEEDIELLQGIGDINELYKVNWDKDLQPKDYRNPELLADALVEAGASFIDPGFFYENIAIGVDRGYLDDDDPQLDEYYEELAQALFDAYGDDKLYYTFYYDDPYETDVMLFSDGGHIIIEDDYFWTDDDFELVSGAGMLEEAKQSSKWDEGIDWDKMYSEDIADALVRSDAVYVHPDKFEQDSLKADKFSPKYHLKNFGTVEPIVDLFGDLYDSDTLHYTIFNDPLRQYTDKFITNRGEFWNVSPDGDDWTEEDYEMVIGAGELNEVISEAWDDGISWGDDPGVPEEAAERLVELGAKFIYFDFDPGELNQTRASYYFEDVATLMYTKYGMEDTLYYSFEDFYDGNELHKAFVFSDGDHVDVSFWDDSDIELVKGAGELLQESLADQPTYVKIEALANDVVEQDLQYYELSNDEREDLIELAAMIRDGEEPIAKWDKTIINILKNQRSKTGKEHYTVTPTMTQIQYPDQQVIDYMYFDEFLTRFLPNADKSDLELLRGAGQLNEVYKGPTWWKDIEWNTEFTAEDIANKFAEIGAEYVPAKELDLPDRRRFIKGGDLEGWAEEAAYDLKIQTYDNPNLTFSIVEIEDAVSLITSDGFSFDLWNFSNEEIELIIGAGQLKENKQSWDDGIDIRYPEDLADRLAEIGAEYYEFSDEDWDEMYARGLEDDSLEVAMRYLQEKGKKLDQYPVLYSLFKDGDGVVYFIFSNYKAITFEDLTNDEIDMIIGAGQLNESTKDEDEKYPKDETSVDSVASWIINNDAEYYELTSEDEEDLNKAYEEGGTASAEEKALLKILKRQKHKDIPIYTYDSTPEIFYILFNDGQYGYYYVEEFKDVPYNDVKDMLIGAGQLNEETISDYPNGSYATEVADFIADNNATYHEITSQEEEDIIQAWDDDRGDDEIEDILKRHKKPNIPVFTWIELSDQFAMLFNDGNIEFYSMYEFKDVDTHPTKGSMDEAWELITGAGQLNENKTSLQHLKNINPSSGYDLADTLANIGAHYVEIPESFIADLEDLDYEERDEELYKILDEILLESDHEVVFTYFPYDETFNIASETFNEIFYLQDFNDVFGQEAIDLIIGAGKLNEESKEYVDPLASITDASKGEQLADALANAGARYVEGEWLDEIEYKYDNEKYSDREREYSDDIVEELRNEFKKEDTIIFTYFQPESVFFTYDGKYYETFYMADFDDISGTADVRMIIDAGLINEALDLEDPKIGDMIDAYTYDIYALIDPKGHNDGNIRELSTGTMYKYGDVQNPADYYMENSWKTLPKPISDQFEDILGSSWMADRAIDYARDAFLENNREAYHEFYGMHDEVDEDLLRDAGYDEWAEEFKSIEKDQLAYFLEDDYEIRFGASIKTDFDGDPESIYVFISCDLNDFSAGEVLKEVDLGKVYKNISSVEALREAMKEFMYDLVPKFMAGEKPAEIKTNDVYEQQKKKPLKENAQRVEELISNIVEWPLHYVDPPQDILDSLADDVVGSKWGLDDYQTELWERLQKYIEDLDRKAGYIDEKGQAESDEGHFTLVGSDFFQDAGFFVNSDQYFYVDSMQSDGYELTPQEYADVIEAGKLYDNDEPINENKDTLIPEDVEYNPTFEQIDEMIENATEELIDAVTRTYDTYGDPTIERLESGDGFMSFADGGFRSHESNNVSNLYGQYAMPTNEIDDAIEKLYDQVYEYAHVSAVELMKNGHREVWAEFSGDPELLTYKNLEDAADAYVDIDSERSNMYTRAAEELDERERDYMYEDDDSLLFFEVEIQYYNANATMNDTGLPMLKFRGAVETNYKTLGAKETEITFTSEEELEEALADGAKEIEDWFDGEERNQNRVGQLTEELSPESSLEIFEIVKSIVEDNTRYPVFENPISGQDIDQEVGIYNYFTDEDYYIDLMKYLSNERVLPRDFQKNEEQYVEEAIWEAAEDEVLGNLDEYVPYEKRMEIKGVHYEIAQLYRTGDLQDIDLEFYEDLHDIIVDKNSDYMNDTGVMQYFEFTVIPEEELVNLTAKVELDPEYDGIEHKNSIEIKIESDLDAFAKKVDQATKELVSWMQGN